MNPRFERLSEENIHHVCDLHHAVYGKRIDITTIQLKYQPRGPFKYPFGTLAFDGNLAIGFMGVIPMLIEYQGKSEWSGFLADGMTLPSHRGWVLFVKILQSNYQMLKDAGISCVWTNSVPQTALLYNKRVGWKPAYEMNAYKISANNRFVALIRRKLNRFIKKGYRDVFREFITEPTQFCSLDKTDSVVLCRDQDFLKYKSAGSSFFVTYLNKIIWMKLCGNLFIGDINISTVKELEDVFRWLIPKARKLGVAEIIFQTSPGSTVDICFAQKYKSFPSWTIGFYNLSSDFPLEKLSVTWADLDTF